MIIMGGVFSQAGAIRAFVDAVNDGKAVGIERFAPHRSVRSYDLTIPLDAQGEWFGYNPDVMATEAAYWETRPGEVNLANAADMSAWGIDITTPLF